MLSNSNDVAPTVALHHQQAHFQDRITELQDLTQMYEGLNLKNEFCSSLRNYTILLFQNGDLSKIKELLLRYGLLDLTKESSEEPTAVNQADSVSRLISYLDESICKA